MLETLITVIHIAVALFMILVVLVQGGNQGGIGAAFGGGNSGGVFGATGATTILGKVTYGAAAIFMMTSMTLTVMQGEAGEVGLKEKLKAQSQSTTEPGGLAPPQEPGPASETDGATEEGSP